MQNLWYVALYNEILIDMDKPISSIPHSDARLAGAILHGKLNVNRVEMHRSFTEDHMHAMITLNEPMGQIDRAIWGVMMHGDIYRGMSTIMRCLHAIPCPDLLITPIPFLRMPDAVCDCDSKHDAATMDKCPAAIVLRGEQRTRSFFGRPASSPKGIFSNYDRNSDENKIYWPAS